MRPWLSRRKTLAVLWPFVRVGTRRDIDPAPCVCCDWAYALGGARPKICLVSTRSAGQPHSARNGWSSKLRPIRNGSVTKLVSWQSAETSLPLLSVMPS